MDWLLAHVDDPDPTEEELAAAGSGQALGASGSETAGSGGLAQQALDDGEITADQVTPQSLKCDDCGRLLRDAAAAEAHAIKTSHVNFSESTQVIKPLTAEEKAQKLKELQARLALKREEKRLAEIEEQKKAEKVRRITGKEMTELKEKHADAEMKKALDAKKREKEEDRIAKAKIKAQIEADKLERQRKAEQRKREAQGLPLEPSPAPKKTAAPAGPPAGQSAVAKNYDETRLQIRVPSGPPIVHSFPSQSTLESVYKFISEQRAAAGDLSPFKLLQTFPRKLLDGAERSKTLKELDLVPSAVLVLQ
ncbi:hypothetical protein HK104_005864 [Borealophlyctis nickersoniae]|nr:hypothetical protein HK104_005864 [Borealophlyctis nickersoniae]